MKEKRDINVEVIRIIAMLMVIATHCMQYCELDSLNGISNGNYVSLQFIRTFISIQNTLFILISGYYATRSKFNLNKILKLWGKTFFYSFILYIIYDILGRNSHPYENLLPVLSGQYWFISAYIALYFISPIISVIIKRLTKNQFRYLLIVLIILYSIIKITFNPSFIFNKGFTLVICVYLVGAYIGLYVPIKNEKNYYFLKCILFVILTTWMSIMLKCINITEHTIIPLIRLTEEILEMFSILTLPIAIYFFMKFKSMDMNTIKLSKAISFISPSIFSVYLIHENINNRWIWKEIGFLQDVSSPLLVVYMFLTTVFVFTVCLVIDIIFRLIWQMLKKISFVSIVTEKLNEKINKVNVKINQYLA